MRPATRRILQSIRAGVVNADAIRALPLDEFTALYAAVGTWYADGFQRQLLRQASAIKAVLDVGIERSEHLLAATGGPSLNPALAEQIAAARASREGVMATIAALQQQLASVEEAAPCR